MPDTTIPVVLIPKGWGWRDDGTDSAIAAATLSGDVLLAQGRSLVRHGSRCR